MLVEDLDNEDRWRRFEYNAGGLQSAEIDARGNYTFQHYDGLGRAAKTIYHNGTEDWIAHDQRGQVVFKRIRSNHQVAIFYDAMGRDYHVREHAQVQSGYMWAGRNSRASYDLAGRPVWRDVSTQTTETATFDEGLLRDVRTYGYDTAGRLDTDAWQPEGPSGLGLTVNYGYDLAGNKTAIAWPQAGGAPYVATYVFDAANRVSSVSFNGVGTTQTVEISHDSLGRRTGINRPGAAADTTYTYEPDSDLGSLSHGFVPGTGPGPTQFSYGHDAAGKITAIAISQPAFEWMPTMAYARTYGAANVMNQIPSENGVGIGWNSDGDMTTDGYNVYEYTHGHRLVRASRPGMTATYDYDSDDRRTRKIVNGVMTRTLWSGIDELAQLDAAGNILRRFIPDGSGAMDARLAAVEADGSLYWHHTDHQGSVIATSRADGTVVAVASYSPHGEFGDGQYVPPIGSPFGYTGREYDPETRLYHYRARYYSPRLGQFLSQDPIGTKDDPNLYLYVGADPVNATDPTGEQICPVFICGTPTLRRVEVTARDAHTGQVQGRVNVLVPIPGEVETGIRVATFATALVQAVYNEATNDDEAVEPRAAPPANDGVSPPHGAEDHDQAIDDRAREVRAQGATDIRKNQTQVNAEGNRVGNNRPDLGYTDRNGVRNNEEWGRNQGRLEGQGDRARQNDPGCVTTGTCLPRS